MLNLSLNSRNKISLIAAISIGVAIPLLPLGIAVTQGLLGIGLVLLLALTPFDAEVRRTYRRLVFDPITIALLLMFVVWLLVTPWSSAPWESSKVIFRTALYIAGSALIWAHLVVHQNLQQKTIKTLIVLMFVMLMISTVILLFPDTIWQAVQSVWGKTTTASRHFKPFASALLCLIPALIWGGYHLGAKWKWASLAMLPLALFTMVATENRSAIAGFIAMVAAVIITIGWSKRKFIIVSVTSITLSVFGGLMWSWLFGERYRNIVDGYLPPWLVDPHRQVIWRFVFEKFLESPFSGHGVNRINYVPGSDVIRADIGGALISAHPHNWILEILSETGIFGFTALATVLLLLLWRMMARYRYANDVSSLALIGLLAAFFGSNLFNFSIWSTWWLLIMFFLFALISTRSAQINVSHRSKKILFVITEDWAFCSHRIPTAMAAHDAGYEVVITARENMHRKNIEEMGFKFVPWNIKRKSLNPFYELRAIINLINIFYKERPDIAYNVTMKPIVYGSFAAHFTGTANTINLFSGLGTLFISSRLKFLFLRKALIPILRYIHADRGTWLMVQNNDDKIVMEEEKISKPDRTFVVPGSGIDVSAFVPLPEPKGPLTAILLSRMLWDKGVGETVDAARMLKSQGRDIRIVLVGEPDTDNPNHIPEQTLRRWTEEGVIEWQGKRDDVSAVWAQGHVALLPSYREGIPRSLLEGAACGRPMIGANSPGCRDLINDGINGLLVTPKDAISIADALIRLDDDPALRNKMGRAARLDVEKIYSTDNIKAKIRSIIKIIESGKPSPVPVATQEETP